VSAFEPGDEARRAERPTGALAGPDRRVLWSTEAFGEKRRTLPAKFRRNPMDTWDQSATFR